ncbi:Glyoxalase-like domain protein [Devosia equisanguinis]|uniref:Glyoxalase-like domain protein n=1 Tax=Devosia equisanguinis TaxID=2490941 RepID=A0A3S4DMZ6_9HYPH|nr:VOC family protein [Devosia equisanguinis]VDS03155.1 Glyoxalase-like domain protein [Devosia equisanguinis]
MKFNSLFPLLQVADVARTAQFYRDAFGFTPVFESDWYVHLKGDSAGLFELAVIDYRHDSIPEHGRVPSAGVILSFYVDDAAAEAKRLEHAGVAIAQPLRDEVFGQRHVIVADPNGVLIDVITPIEPDADWLKAQIGQP